MATDPAQTQDESIDEPTSPEPSTRSSRPKIALDLPRPGDLIADAYRVVDWIGEGAMGVVLLAEDERLERRVAIKLIRHDQRTSRYSHVRFLDEARAMARVRHVNVVEIFALGEWRGSPYLVMEYVPGRPLSQVLERRGSPRMTLDAVAKILDQLCRGVAAIHAVGMAHRDLKPGNVFITRDFRVAVGDFGLARSWDAAHKGGRVSGTPAYLAPETALGEAVAPALATRADIYALGVLAYELLTGRLPFEETDHVEMLKAHATRPAPAPRTIRPDLPPAVDAVIAATLAKDPAQRTPTVEELRRDLLDALRPGAPRRNARILVADDDKAFRDALALVLVHDLPGTVVEGVEDGAAALRSIEHEAPAVAIFDLDMPSVNGLELTAAVRARVPAARMPILVITGSGSAADWRVLSSVGAQACLLKPVDADEVVAVVGRLLARSAAAAGK